jgi:acyl carrier protein
MKEKLVVDLENEIRNFLKKYIPENKFSDETNIFAEGFVNSLFAMDLIVFIEKNYHFKISNEDLKIDNFKSVLAISQLIQSKTQF